MADPCYLVQEIDGVSRFTLEDDSGFILLEFCPAPGPDPGMGGGPQNWGRRRRRQRIQADEEALISLVLTEL